MARIRSLKPEHRQHRKIGPLSHCHYRLWVGMLLEADDAGRLVCDVGQLRVTIFGYHRAVTDAIVEAGVQQLAELGLVRLYVQNGTRYADFPSWDDHQRLDHPRPSKLPPYEDSRKMREDSRKIREDSLLIETNRNETKRKGANSGALPESAGNPQVGPTPPDALAPRDVTSEARAVLDFLNQQTGRSFKPERTTVAPIIARLRDGANVALCRAVVARKVKQWGGDAKMALYLKPSTLFNGTKFAEYAGELPPDVRARVEAQTDDPR